MHWTEILTIILVSTFVVSCLGVYFYKRSRHLPTGECSYCSHSKTGRSLLKDYNKTYKKIKK